MEKVLNMKIPDKLYNDLKAISESKNISMAALVRMILSDYLNDNSK